MPSTHLSRRHGADPAQPRHQRPRGHARGRHTTRSSGTVSVDSTLGTGSRFTFPAASPIDTPSPPPRTARQHSRQLRSALLVEDDELVRRAIMRVLQGANFDVTAVVDGGEALALVEEVARHSELAGLVFITTDTQPPPSLPLPTTHLTKPFRSPDLLHAIDEAPQRDT